ncbi:uncharacterized protein LOC131519477 [Neofelis nebulosa]|uniref:uncharacterized protein LOC131519477 n=1 Tax=Neofelis nebulosa TaxID=61452 RepID=UPI00272C092D|nr:uncharacterized protein LOC131519477 [Neofelis nebulosa]
MVQRKPCHRAILPGLCVLECNCPECAATTVCSESPPVLNPLAGLDFPFWGGGPSPFLFSFDCLFFFFFLSFFFFFFFSFTRICLISLPELGYKGTASSHPRWGVSAPRPEACSALLAIIFDARPPEPLEPAARARAHLPPPLAIYLHLAGAFLGSEHLRSRRCTLRGSRDLLPAAHTLNSSLLLPCRWFRTAYSAAACRTLGWDCDFSRLFAPWFVAHPSLCLSRALFLHLSLPASEVPFSVGHRQNIPIIRFQRKECPPYLNHKTIKPRRLASSALLFCSAPFRIQRRETNSAIKVAFRGFGNVPIRCLPKWNNL